MSPIQDQIAAIARDQFDAGFTLYATLASKAFDSAEKLVKLNLATVKESFNDSAATAKQALAVKDPQELIALLSGQTGPALEKAVSYNSQTTAIATDLYSTFTSTAETHIANTNRTISALIEEATKNAPLSADNIASFMTSAFGNAGSGYEQFSKTAKQAMEAFEANLNAAVGRFVPTVTTKK